MIIMFYLSFSHLFFGRELAGVCFPRSLVPAEESNGC